MNLRSFNIPRSTVSRVYWEYLVEGISTHRGQRSGRQRVLNGSHQRCPARTVRGNGQATLADITPTFDAGGTNTYPAGQ
jgi:hypothetical protein